MKRIVMVLVLVCFMSSSVYAAELSLTLTVPDAIKTDVINAFAYAYKYQDTINGQPNPQTKAQFAKEIIKQFIREVYKKYKVETQLNQDTLIQQADTASTGIGVQ
jgi:hypothetical protein